MPSPLGHAAIGLVVHNVCSREKIGFRQWREASFVCLLAILPDIDVLVGLLSQGNGNAFHRGYSHSLLFILCSAFVASVAHRLWSQIPRITFGICFALVLSHVLADFLLTDYGVSWFWPFGRTWAAPSYAGWGDVMHDFLRQTARDAGIVIGCGILLAGIRLMMTCGRSWAASRQRSDPS